MVYDLALQISQDEELGKYLVISASDIGVDDLVNIGKLLGVVE